VLTKAIGTGIITTAAKNLKEPPPALKGAVESMALLNRGGAEAMVAVGVNAATDITGFGLLGHLHGMLRASGVAARLRRGGYVRSSARRRSASRTCSRPSVPSSTRPRTSRRPMQPRWRRARS
jgi:selenophosphate synthase